MPEQTGQDHRPSPQNGPTVSPVPALLRRVLRRMENVLFGLFLSLALIYFIIQLPFVQTWLIDRITGWLSDDLDAKVSIKRVDISFFDNLILEDLFLSDQKGDTLLFAGKLSAGLDPNIFTVFSNQLEFNKISLDKARFYIRRREGEERSNIVFLIDYFSGASKKPKKQKKPFHIRVQNCYLNDVVFINDDDVSGRKMQFSVDFAAVRINKLDIPSKIADIQSVSIEGMLFDYEERAKKPLPLLPLPRSEKRPDSNAVRNPFVFRIGRLFVDKGRFEYDKFRSSPGRTEPFDVMNYKHLAVSDIGIQAEQLAFTDQLDFSGILRHFSAREQSGFHLQHAEANQFIVNDTLTALLGARIRTEGAYLGDTILMHYGAYRDFYNFTDQVAIDVRLSPDARLKLGDLRYFAGSLWRNRFLTDNKDITARISGSIDGKLNRLNGRNLKVHLNEYAFADIDFDADNMINKDAGPPNLSVAIRQMQSDLPTLRKIIPAFKPPAYFNRLGNIRFSDGHYDFIFGTTHILAGKVQSDIGDGAMDMKLDTDKQEYSGSLYMSDFDLGEWTGSKDFGKSTFHVNIKNGAGFTLKTLEADVEGALDTLTYRGYRYRNVRMDGNFRQLMFDGNLKFDDPNIDLTFNGKVNLRDTIPVYSFDAAIKLLDLGALNLVDEDWQIRETRIQNVQMRGKKLDDIAGSAVIRNFKLLQDKQTWHAIDSVRFESYFLPDSNRIFRFDSDIAAFNMEGRFSFTQTPKRIQQIISRYHPKIAKQLGIVYKDSTYATSKDAFKYRLDIFDSKALTQLFAPDLDTLRNIWVQGKIDLPNGVSELAVSIPHLHYKPLTADSISIVWDGLGAEASYDIRLPKMSVSGQKISPVLIEGHARNDMLRFSLQAQEDSSLIVNEVYLDGEISVIDSAWQIRFNPSNIKFFNQRWYIERDNYVRLAKNYIDIRNFDLGNTSNQRVTLDSLNNGRGIKFSMTNFDVAYLSNFARYRNITYKGNFTDFDVFIGDVFKFKDIKIYLGSDLVYLKDKPYGNINGFVSMDSLNAPLKWEISLVNTESGYFLSSDGAWLNKNGQEQPLGALGDIRPGEIIADVQSNDFPLEILQLIIPGISKTDGMFDLSAKVKGPASRPSLKGEAWIRKGQFQIDYLKTVYHIKNQPILLDNYRIWADGDTVYDGSERSMAFVKGGLRHNLFRSWRIECELRSAGNDFMLLNTKKGDNALYYGQGIGKFEAKFGGDFSRTDILVNATTGKESRLYIPLIAPGEAKDKQFIQFKTKDKDIKQNNNKTKNFQLKDLKGLNIEMNLTLTEEAEVQLIFDEQAGDIVKGRGEGDISLLMNREGDFKMYGSYVIKRGEYLFTLLNLVNKPFSVAEGGTINWYGDPYGAQINLDATYEKNASIYNLMQDQLLLTGVGDENDRESRQSTRTQVIMHLKGDLFKPIITFDLAFPNISPQFKSLVDNKLRLLKQDQNELTRQVFGIVVLGSFLPSNSAVFTQSSDYLATAYNTFTQFLSSQLSNYLSNFAAEWFGGKVSSIDFDIAYNDYTLNLPDQNLGRELQVRLTSGFADDRVTVQFGSQFGLGQRPNQVAQDGFLGEDVTVEIRLTENRQWRLKVYQRLEPDIAGQLRRQRYGAGISFRQEYDSLDELVKDFSGKIKKRRRGG